MGLPIHPFYLIILLAIVLIIFGPGKLPELGGAVGRGIREFRKASTQITDEVQSSIQVPEQPPVTTSPAAAATEHKAETEQKS